MAKDCVKQNVKKKTATESFESEARAENFMSNFSRRFMSRMNFICFFLFRAVMFNPK